MAVRLRRVHGEFEYFRVLEVTRKGWPHYHLIVRSEYIPHATIKSVWAELTGATIVDVRKIKKSQDVYFYLVKYLGKQKYIPWTNRRVSWTRHFFPKSDFMAADPLQLELKGWIDEHPQDVLRKQYRPYTIRQYSNDCWTIQPDAGEMIGESLPRRRKRSSES